MIRYGRLLGIVVGLVSICAVTASARPRRAEYHPAVCVMESVAGGAGGSSGTPGLSYQSMSLTIKGADIWTICPLQHLTFGDDTTIGVSYATVNVEVQYFPSAPTTCEILTEYGTSYVSIPVSFPTGPGVTSGTATGSAYLTLPVMSTPGPIGLRLRCNFKKDTIIGPIELQLD